MPLYGPCPQHAIFDVVNPAKLTKTRAFHYESQQAFMILDNEVESLIWSYGVPYAWGLLTKSVCIWWVFAAIKTLLPIFVLTSFIMLSSCGLYRAAARCSSAEQPPFVPLVANSAGTQPRGPVPVTRTRRAPRLYSFCSDENGEVSGITHVIAICYV